MTELVLGSATERYVWVPVTVRVAVDGGKTQSIKLQAKLLDPGQDRASEVFETQMSDAEVVAEMLDGWKSIIGIGAPDGANEISYDNDDHRLALLNFTGVEAAITAAWIEMVRGQTGRRKNS